MAKTLLIVKTDHFHLGTLLPTDTALEYLFHVIFGFWRKNIVCVGLESEVNKHYFYYHKEISSFLLKKIKHPKKRNENRRKKNRRRRQIFFKVA